MFYMLALAGVVVITGFLPPKYGLKQNNYKNYTILCGLLIVLIMGLRYKLTGSPDTYSYCVTFKAMRGFDNFQEYYDIYMSERFFLFNEWAFYYCVYLLSIPFEHEQILIFATALFITYAICRFIHKNTDDAPLGVIIYICLGMFTFNMNGMRQAVAMAICLFAFEYAKKQKFIPFALIVLIAMQFHKSALFYAPVFFFPMIKNTKGNWLIYLCGILIFFTFMDQLVPWFNEATGKDYTLDAGAEGGGLFVVLLYVGAIILTILRPKILDKKMTQIALCGVIFGLASYLSRFIFNDMLERVSYYYFYFLMILIPEAIDALEGEEQKVVKALFVAFAVLLFAYRTVTGPFSNLTLFFLK